MLGIWKLKRRVKDVLFWRVLPGIYRRAAASRLDSRKAVLVEMRAPELTDDLKLINERLIAGGFDVHVHLMGQSRVGRRQYYANCRALVRDIADAPFVFLTDACNIISCVDLREETQVVQLWHACGAFKKWGMSTGDLLFGEETAWKQRHPYYGNLSLVTISSPEVAWAYIEAMDLAKTPGIVEALGCSRTDVFFDAAWLGQARKSVEREVEQARGKKILLYAPTFRGKVREAAAPDALDIELLRKRCGDDYVLLVKQHPYVQCPPKIPESCRDFAFDVSRALPIDKLLACADMLITDYSSVIFEYSLMRRPMAFFAYDIDDYTDWRGFYYDYDELTPGPICTSTQALLDWIAQCERGFDTREVDAFAEKFMSACDGHATDRIMARVFGSEHPVAP